jgi:hypothetical protein
VTKAREITYTTIFGEVVTTKVRGKHYIEPRGYVRPPGTGPQGETCGSCKHLVHKRMGKLYPKCRLASAIWTGGRGSDVLVRSPACDRWEAE